MSMLLPFGGRSHLRSPAPTARAIALFNEHRRRLDCSTDRLFAVLFIVQWIAEIGVALWISPRAWAGQDSYIHPHVWVAVFLGGAVISVPLLLVHFHPGRASTRQAIAVAQAVTSALLIHLTGGRIETHFHVFASLALLAFYRDWRVLATMSAVVALDHLARGIVWPQSVYGLSTANPWRFLEHTGWVLMEVVGLVLLSRQWNLEAWKVAQRQAESEAATEETLRANAQLRDEIAARQRTQFELEAAKNAAESANRAKSDFLANTSHELRTPLNAIIGFSDILSERVFGPLNDNQSQYVTDILESGQHLLSLVNDILDLSKIESGSMELQIGSVLPRRLVERTIHMFRERAVRQQIRLIGEAGDDLVPIEADERRLKQLLYNLLSNALKFTPSGGEVRVKARRIGEAVELSVSDTGIGIPADKQEKIFESFYQVDSTLTKDAAGTGLGLSVVRQIAVMHGGTVTVSSEVGLGSTFIVWLPTRQPTSSTNETDESVENALVGV